MTRFITFRRYRTSNTKLSSLNQSPDDDNDDFGTHPGRRNPPQGCPDPPVPPPPPPVPMATSATVVLDATEEIVGNGVGGLDGGRVGDDVGNGVGIGVGDDVGRDVLGTHPHLGLPSESGLWANA